MLLTFEYPRFFRMPIARLLRLPRRQYRKIGVSLEIDRLNLSITESGMFTALLPDVNQKSTFCVPVL